MSDIANQAESIFIIGSNTTEQHPVFGAMIRQAVRKRNIPLIVADPRKIDITEFAKIHLQHQPGSDIALLNGIMHIILNNKWHDEQFIQSRTENFDAFLQVINHYSPQRVSEICQISEDELFSVAKLLANNRPTAVIWAMGITQHTSGVANVLTLANLQMLLGNMGIPGGGVNPLRGQNNVQGACDMGGLPNVFPGYQPVNSADAQAKFEHAWGAVLSPKPGKTVTEMIDLAGTGEIRALYILGENPVLSDPNGAHVRESLANCELLILQEIFPSATSEYADILLPGVSFAEKSGTYTNTERRIQMVTKAIAPIGNAKQDWQITSLIAQRILELRSKGKNHSQYGTWQYSDPAEIMREISKLTPIYAGVNHARLLQGDQLQWPVKNDQHSGTPILHVGNFSRGLGMFSPIEYIPPAELPDEEYPFILNTGRVLYHWHGGEMTRRASGLLEIYPEALLEVNMEDAGKLMLNDGSVVNVSSRRGSIFAKVWITERVPPGMVYGNFHFPNSPINDLTNPALDPVAKIPEYKVSAVKLVIV